MPPAQWKLLQMEASKATVCRKDNIRQYSAYSGTIIAYGGFAWLPRQRKQIRQVTWQRRTCMLGSGSWNQATKNMEAGTWRLGSWNQATKNMEAGTFQILPIQEEARAGKRSEAELGRQPPASDRPGLSGRLMLIPSPFVGGEVYVLRISVTVNGTVRFHEM